MDIFDGLSALGGLCLFLFGMSIMAEALQRRAGGRLGGQLRRMTRSRWAGFFTGLAVTAAVQSSSAAMVMVVGFVNSGLLTLGQAVGVIMGTNVGTTVTPWLLSLGGPGGGRFSGAAAAACGLRAPAEPVGHHRLSVQEWPPPGYRPGPAGLCHIDAGNGADVRLCGRTCPGRGLPPAVYGLYGPAAGVAGRGGADGGDPVQLRLRGDIAGPGRQRSGYGGCRCAHHYGAEHRTCITAMLSSVGASRNARRAALVHLLFNLTGAGVWLAVFWVVKVLAAPTMLARPVTLPGVAVIHTAFNLLCTMLLFPAAGLLERAVLRLLPGEEGEKGTELDPRLLAAPAGSPGKMPGAGRGHGGLARDNLQPGRGCSDGGAACFGKGAAAAGGAHRPDGGRAGDIPGAAQRPDADPAGQRPGGGAAGADRRF